MGSRHLQLGVLGLLLCGGGAVVWAQSSDGELRVHVQDEGGRGVAAKVLLRSEAQQVNRAVSTDGAGNTDLSRLRHGLYQVVVTAPGFSNGAVLVEVESALPLDRVVRLALASVQTEVQVHAGGTLIDPERAGASSEVGSAEIARRPAGLPGRSMQELVNTQPGWLFEGNAVLHPRGSEYQTQFVVDGVPLTDDRSPGAGPPLEAEGVESLQVYTAGIPAEFGRKMGGVVEVTTERETDPGVHGRLALSGGSYATAGAFGQMQWVKGGNTFGVNAEGDRTDHYLNPVVPENFTNAGTAGAFAANYARELGPNDRLTMGVRHTIGRFQVPNELLQQQAGQRVTGEDLETMGTAAYQQVFAVAETLGRVEGMVRDVASELQSNAQATPVAAAQSNGFREGYVKGTVAGHWRGGDWKAGVESDATVLHERFADRITDLSQFDPGTPEMFAFTGSRADLEQAVFVEDTLHAGAWTVRAGLRWDHYQLLLNQQGWSPRLSVARYFAGTGTVAHFSYDRVFQTPASRNILLASSGAVVSLNPNVLRLPVQPSRGNYYEGGVSQAVGGRLRADVNVFRRDVSSFADDDQLLNTAVSFPIAFRKAVIYGAETKIELPVWRGVSGYVSNSYQVGDAWFPVTGGLFLGQSVLDAATQLTGHFPVSQDQRNTARTRWQYQVRPRWWVAGSVEGNSGLPFAYQGTASDALAQYGPAVLGRLNFGRGRVRPVWLLGATAGVELYRKGEKRNVRLQVDGANLTNRLDVIDFGGLFSGNAIGPERSVGLRLTGSF